MSGNDQLIIDLQYLLDDAKENVFDDFKSPLATPRIELNLRLQRIVQANINGKYDG